MAPWGLGLSFTFESRSGDPWARTLSAAASGSGNTIPSITLRVEPIGTERLPEINLTNFRVEKTLSLTARQRVTLRANLYDALNSQVPTAVTTLTGRNYGIATALVPPRIFELSGAACTAADGAVTMRSYGYCPTVSTCWTFDFRSATCAWYSPSSR